MKKQLEPYKEQERKVAAQSTELKQRLKDVQAQKQAILEGCKQLMLDQGLNQLQLSDPNNPAAPLGTMKLAKRATAKGPKFSYYDLEKFVQQFQQAYGTPIAEEVVEKLMGYIFWTCLEMTDAAPQTLTVKKVTAKEGSDAGAARNRLYKSLPPNAARE
jgi:hypothetical protein